MSRLSRRDVALALLALPLSSAAAQAPRDQGIGGTGAAPRPPAVGDRGIGGTGVIGTIRRFGSIYVNGLRIAYPPDAEVIIDGRRARAADLRIGHVVQAVAAGPDGALSARRIEVFSEVVGPVERIVPNGAVVLGQVVDLRGAPRGALATGVVVAVFGQRRPNGVIVASLVERRPAAASRVLGPVTVDAAGRPSIGGLALRGAPAGLAGTRVSLEGVREGDLYRVTRFRSLARPFAPGVGRVSIEGYANGAGGLASGFDVSGVRGTGLAVVDGRINASGAVVADAVRLDRSPVPDLGGPAPLSPPSVPLPGLGGELLPSPGGLLPGRPGGVAPGAPGLGLPSAPAAPNLGLPGGGLGLPGLRR